MQEGWKEVKSFLGKHHGNGGGWRGEEGEEEEENMKKSDKDSRNRFIKMKFLCLS